MSHRLLFWLLLGLVQLAAPAWMILREERILSQGHEYKFRLAPVDPADPFRGRYMSLSFDVETLSYLPERPPVEREEPLYAVLGRDADGFASITSLRCTKPAGDHLLIPADSWNFDWKEKHSVRVQLPFRRFYLNETQAAAVENKARDLVAEARKNNQKADVHALLRVLDGHGTLTDLRGPDNRPLR